MFQTGKIILQGEVQEGAHLVQLWFSYLSFLSKKLIQHSILPTYSENMNWTSNVLRAKTHSKILMILLRLDFRQTNFQYLDS